MNEIEKLLNTKRTENGDIAYKTTGNNLTDLFFMTAYFEKHLDQVHIGTSEKERVFSMFVRDPRFGLGRRDLGRKLMMLSGVPAHNIITAGRYDDLWHIPTDENLGFLKIAVSEKSTDRELAKKWLPRLTGKDRKIAKALSKMWFIGKENYTFSEKIKAERKYRELIKTDSTTEYKLSYAEPNNDGTPLDDLFHKNKYNHPLVNEINFEQVPSLAMAKYLKVFSTREDIKPRFDEYMQAVKANKAKVNVSTTTVHDAMKTVNAGGWVAQSVEENQDILGKKMVENATIGVEMNAIVILDSSGSMGGWSYFGNRDYSNSLLGKAMSIAHGIATHSTYAKNQIISFSSTPKLMTIKGETLKEQYDSMYTGDCSNTDFAKVMKLLQKLNKYPEYIIVLSDMEFDYGSSMSKQATMKLFKDNGAETKIIWWNLNGRAQTVPEIDEYGNYYLSGYNIQILKLLENKMDMTSYIDKILEKYKRDINYVNSND